MRSEAGKCGSAFLIQRLPLFQAEGKTVPGVNGVKMGDLLEPRSRKILLVGQKAAADLGVVRCFLTALPVNAAQQPGAVVHVEADQPRRVRAVLPPGW